MIEIENEIERIIKFVDFIVPPDSSLTKVKFNMNPATKEVRAWDLLLEDDDGWFSMIEWKKKQSNNNYGDAKYLIAFAQYYPYGPEYFIFGGLFEIEKVMPEVFDGRGYKLEKLLQYEKYEKRLIIKLKKPIGRDLYNRWFDNLDQQLSPEVYEIAPRTKLGAFPGFQNVILRHHDLVNIVKHNEPMWRLALSQIKGVYAITDISTGKLYIGSASGNYDGIWQRWSSYAQLENPTGGNKAFIEIWEKEKEYIFRNFQYSILEIFDKKTKVNLILERENYWKNVFQTRTHGYNQN